MKNLKSIVLTALAVVFAASLVLPATSVSAQGSAALSIVPRKNYTVEPGKSVDDTLVVRNLDDEEALVLSLRVIDFTFTDDGGTPKLMLAEDAPQTVWSLKPFLTVPKTVTIAPGTSETLDMRVSIPANHGAGDYYSAIVYSSGASDGSNVGLSASGVTLVFTKIPGEVDENLTLEQFGAYHPARDGKEAGYSYISTTKPEMIAYTLKNEGNVTQAPVGTITIKPLFGEEKVINNINPNQSLALIGQTRTFTSCIKLESADVNFQGRASQTSTCTEPDLWPGFYSVTINAFYGHNGNDTQEITGKASFWYLPWWFILAATFVLLIVAYFVWRVVSFFRRHFGKGSKFKQRSKSK